MPRKKSTAPDAAHDQNNASTANAVAQRPDWIDGPPVTPEGKLVVEATPEAKNWGNPYKAIVTMPTFELGEDRRFKQRVFTFKEKPSDDILASLKENGFTYRANEKAWTIQANPEARRLSDELAQEFASGIAYQTMSR